MEVVAVVRLSTLFEFSGRRFRIVCDFCRLLFCAAIALLEFDRENVDCSYNRWKTEVGATTGGFSCGFDETLFLPELGSGGNGGASVLLRAFGFASGFFNFEKIAPGFVSRFIDVNVGFAKVACRELKEILGGGN